MVQPCSFLILLTAFSAMVMVRGAPLDTRSSEHHVSDGNHPASKNPSDVSKLQTMPSGCIPGGMCSDNTRAGLMQVGPPVPPSGGPSTGNSAPASSDPAVSAPAGSAIAGSDPAGSAVVGSAPAGSAPAGSAPAGSPFTGSTSNGLSNGPGLLKSNRQKGKKGKKSRKGSKKGLLGLGFIGL